MKYLLLVLVCVFSTASSFSQSQDAWVFFTDKPGAQAMLANPQAFLTQESIDRKNMHGTTIDVRDVPVHEPYITTIKSQQGITVLSKSKWMNCVHVRGSETEINNLSSLNFVDSIDFADNNLDARPFQSDSPFDDNEIIAVSNFDYGQATNQITQINLDQLHTDGFTGQGIKIAVLDSGFPNVNSMTSFDRLRTSPNQILGGYDFVADDNTFYGDHLHGTRVLSHMAAFEPMQYAGSAPDAEYYLFRTEDATSENPVEESYWVEAAERADSLGVDVINTSLGYLTFDNPAYNYTYADMDGQTTFIARGANIASEKGILVVTSAGNSGGSAAHPYISSPGDAIGSFTIGAVDASGNYASFSSIGPSSDNRVKPDIVAQGQGTFHFSENDMIVQGSGTSYSAPIAAGGIASLWSMDPTMTNTQIMDFVRQSASRFNNPNAQLGYGLPDFDLAATLLLNDLESQDDPVVIFPNPANDVLNFTLSRKQSPSNLQIFNNLGQLVLETQVKQDEPLNIEQLSSGVYFLTLQNPIASYRSKLIKE